MPEASVSLITTYEKKVLNARIFFILCLILIAALDDNVFIFCVGDYYMIHKWNTALLDN